MRVGQGCAGLRFSGRVGVGSGLALTLQGRVRGRVGFFCVIFVQNEEKLCFSPLYIILQAMLAINLPLLLYLL